MTAPRSRLVWLVIDGLSWQLVEQRAACRPDSTLTRALRERKAIRLMPLAPNCQTPPSLFSIFSGTDVTRHGLTGYLVPTPSHDTPFGFADGFTAWPRDIPMVWDRWAAAGQRLRLCAAPFVQPARLGDALVGRTNVYGGIAVAPDTVRDGGRLTIPALDIDMQVEAVEDGIALHDVRRASDSPRLVPMDGTLALPLAPHVPHGNAYRAIALHAMRIDGAPTLISLGYRAVDVLGDTAPLAAFPACDPARLYANGRLGRRLDEGGDGAAERALVSLMRIVHDSFATDIVAAVRAADADCVVGYDPVIDLLSHHLLKYVDPRQPASPASRVVDALFDTALGWIDALLDACLAASPEPVRCIAHSDHGMAPVHQDLFPNAFFEQAGLLDYDAAGQPDPLRSAALFHPAENGLVMLHPANLAAKGFDHETLIEAWRAALPGSMRDGWHDFDGPGTTPPELPPVAGWRAQCYWQAPPGTRLRYARSAQVVQASRKGGDHAVWSGDPWLQGILADVGHQPVGLPDQAALALSEIAALVCPEHANAT
ncbi:alkaline phosphatase family protein [Burkholderia gladioli]|uniref:alkaline phosphatase family protein n=1 Tax=Burkholderia gladioli TaxID=28095 RepID=UPI00163F340C|nr:alkaline phosphatase family protein [Burkholderia gladioli]